MASDEGRVDALFFDEFADELVEHARVGERRRTYDASLLEHAAKELVRVVCVQLVP